MKKLFVLILALTFTLLTSCAGNNDVSSATTSKATGASSPTSVSTSTSIPTDVEPHIALGLTMANAPDVGFEDKWYSVLLPYDAPSAGTYSIMLAENETNGKPLYKDVYMDFTYNLYSAVPEAITPNGVMGLTPFFAKFGINGTDKELYNDEYNTSAANVNNRFNWCKDNGFLMTKESKDSFISRSMNGAMPFTGANAVDNLRKIDAEWSAMTENYLKAKYEGIPLTAKTSDWFNKFTSFEKGQKYVQDKAPDAKVEVGNTEINFMSFFPSVAVEYTLKSNGESVVMRDVFFIAIDGEAGNWQYSIDYIANLSDFNDKFIAYSDFRGSKYGDYELEY